jgi:hypothetical protein
VLLTLFWKRCNTGGIVLGMVVGTLTAIGLVLVSPNLTYPLAVKARRRRSSLPRPRNLRRLNADLAAATEAPAQDKLKAAIAKSEKAKSAAEVEIKEIGSDRTSIVGSRSRVRSAQPGSHLDSAGLPRRDPGLAAVPRQALRGHVGRALCAPEHRPFCSRSPSRTDAGAAPHREPPPGAGVLAFAAGR